MEDFGELLHIKRILGYNGNLWTLMEHLGKLRKIEEEEFKWRRGGERERER